MVALPGFAVPSVPYLFSQREDDPEAQTKYYRARSMDPRTGRFIEKDSLIDGRVRVPYVYCDNSPSMGVDPHGTRTFVKKDEQFKRIFIRTEIVLKGRGTTGFWDSFDVYWNKINAFKDKYLSAINHYWNNDDNGWEVTFKGGGTYRVFFVPSILPSNYFGKSIPGTADIVTYREDDEVTESHTAAMADPKDIHRALVLVDNPTLYKGDPLTAGDSTDLPRGIPLPPNRNHEQHIIKSQSSEAVIAHEYGHLLGETERYTRTRAMTRSVVTPDEPKFAGDIMGQVGAKATPRAIEEFFHIVGNLVGGAKGADLGTATAVPGTRSGVAGSPHAGQLDKYEDVLK